MLKYSCSSDRLPLTDLISSFLIDAGVNVVGISEEPFHRRFTVLEDLGSKSALIEVHLASIDMLVSVRVGPVNNISSITTAYLPRKTSTKEVSTWWQSCHYQGKK